MKRILPLVVLAVLLLSTSIAHAVPITYVGSLTGPAENPSNNSQGVGAVIVTIDTAANTLRIVGTFSGLGAPTTAAHIHCCIAPPGNVGVTVTAASSLEGFPLGVTSGSYDGTFNTEAASTYRSAFITANGGTPAGAEAALAAGLAAGQAYFNIHTSGAFSGGEIRDFLHIPEPASALLFGIGLLGLRSALRRRK